jgi:iron complex outermembrane receptor protein
MGNEVATVSRNGYMNHINNYIFIAPTADTVGPLKVFRWRQHDATISGLELNLNLHPVDSWFEGYMQGGVIRGQMTDDAGDLPYIPANKLITGLTFKNNHAKKWLNPYVTVQIGAYGTQNDVAAFEEPSSGYILTDLSLAQNLHLENINAGLALFSVLIYSTMATSIISFP